MRTRERYPAPAEQVQVRDRSRTALVNPDAQPEAWPNGSGVFRTGTAHLKSDKGLLGRIIAADDRTFFRLWRYCGAGRYVFAGRFRSWHVALEKLRG